MEFQLSSFPAGLCGGRVFPGNRPVPDLVVPGKTASPSRGSVDGCFAPGVDAGRPPVGDALLQYTHHRAGLAGWQWLFLLEGVPAVLLGLVTLCYLTDRPEGATWLKPDERSWLVEQMAREEERRDHHHAGSLRQAAADPRVWHLVALASTIALGISVQSVLSPTTHPGSLSSSRAFRNWPFDSRCRNLHPPRHGRGRHSQRPDRRTSLARGRARLSRRRRLGAEAAWREVPHASFLGMIIAQAGMMSMSGPFWSLASAYLGSRAAAGGIALINAIANLGAFWPEHHGSIGGSHRRLRARAGRHGAHADSQRGPRASVWQPTTTQARKS